MDKIYMEMTDRFIEQHGDKRVTVAARTLLNDHRYLYEVINMTADLCSLFIEESVLKKHHRAYLHVREEIDQLVDTTLDRLEEILEEQILNDYSVEIPEDNSPEPCANCDGCSKGEETVTIPKNKYELMIDDLLTMSEIIQCVADMRTQDMKAIREFGKFVPAFAAFEKNRLNLYREAAKEAEEIFDRWADEIDDLDEDFMEDEDYEPGEYYSD